MSAAEALRTLAGIFAGPLDPEKIEALAGTDHILSRALQEDRADCVPPALDEALSEEFTRLFEAPVGAHAPLQGLRCGDDELLGPNARGLLQAYCEADREPDPQSGLLPDHLSVALGFLAELLESGQDDRAAHFVARHLGRWVPAWVEGYSADASKRFYKVAGALLLDALHDLRAGVPAS